MPPKTWSTKVTKQAKKPVDISSDNDNDVVDADDLGEEESNCLITPNTSLKCFIIFSLHRLTSWNTRLWLPKQ